MTRYEYKVIPAPNKGLKAPGIKGPEARFAHGLETAMNALAAEGWEYQRSDILPSEERQGLTSTHTVYRSVLVFRRALEEEPPVVAEAEPEADTAPGAPDPAPETEPNPAPEPEPAEDRQSQTADPDAETPEHAEADDSPRPV
ncbi:DUF4177 domain-containing protein [Roseovarius faecimaris]|uniref:DUF4177 domain-containing protein n=1 Tax=Roseovarius faecimaris TaxID=2494550 RepID=A0A6I6IQ62_9RHOB|nr:DUF4177 domain-containing protein [Roseovarius faecimaris]QGX97963.1 DUF4177 domain-containing protein [Roseovarius faecimaris]